MNCVECGPLLTDYQHGELDALKDAAVYSHLQSCAGCRGQLRAEQDLTDALRVSYAAERDFPMAVLAGVRQAMRAQSGPSVLERMRALLRPALVAPAAALVIVAAVGVLRYDQAPVNAPAFSSAYFVRQHIARTIGSPASDRAWSAYLLTSTNTEEPSDSSGVPFNN